MKEGDTVKHNATPSLGNGTVKKVYYSKGSGKPYQASVEFFNGEVDLMFISDLEVI